VCDVQVAGFAGFPTLTIGLGAKTGGRAARFDMTSCHGCCHRHFRSQGLASLKHEIVLLNDKARSPITSTVMSKEAALGANAGRILSFAGGAVVIAAAIFGVYAWLSFADNDRTLGWIMVAMMVFFIVAIVAAAAWGRHYWHSRLDERLRPQPPAGTRIRFDENTLVIGERIEPLSALRLDRIYLRTATRGSKFSSSVVYELNRLVMTTPRRCARARRAVHDRRPAPGGQRLSRDRPHRRQSGLRQDAFACRRPTELARAREYAQWRAATSGGARKANDHIRQARGRF
jgi:hypothetical protein